MLITTGHPGEIGWRGGGRQRGAVFGNSRMGGKEERRLTGEPRDKIIQGSGTHGPGTRSGAGSLSLPQSQQLKR